MQAKLVVRCISETNSFQLEVFLKEMNNNANAPQITLTPTQQRVLDHMLRFIDSSQQVFILTGYAGTGKTTMMNAFVAELAKRDVQHILMASTGRAAKI